MLTRNLLEKIGRPATLLVLFGLSGCAQPGQMGSFFGHPVTPGYYDLADSGGGICFEDKPCVGYERTRWRELGPDCEGPFPPPKNGPAPLPPGEIQVEVLPTEEPEPATSEPTDVPPSTGNDNDPAPGLPGILPDTPPAGDAGDDPPPLLPQPGLPDPFPEQGGDPAPMPGNTADPLPGTDTDPFPTPVNPNPLPGGDDPDPGLFPETPGNNTTPDGGVPNLFPKKSTPVESETNLVKFGRVMSADRHQEASTTIYVEATEEPAPPKVEQASSWSKLRIRVDE